ncbi:nucleoside deaminase [Marivirga sp. S37H4]|uniref:Nucleoside deaminase n=1 Tax=Marivirga aurantiaca TaxID=2802615 RepID=A0A935C9S2_9BACT|nr:nucleoside deaminase [Marivirga aurantiaca]MBK6264418.1 nucleoside deaminase [Marivirga aurantiaca]
MEESHEFWMKMAIDLARESKTPFGSVIVDNEGQFVGAYNTAIHDGAIAHAEINALRKIDKLDYNHPEDLIIYSTVEPCPMCMSAIIWTEIGQVVYGADIPFASTYCKQINLRAQEVANTSTLDTIIMGGILKEDCESLFKLK